MGPNNSFKPTPCRGIGHVLYATLAHVRRPNTGRLNSGVRPRMKISPLLIFLMIVGCSDHGRVVEGTFVVNGKPKSGVEVRLPNNLEDFSNCGGAPLLAVTDRSGNFKASTTKFPIRPCFTVDGKIYSDFFVVDDRKQDPIKLRCELPLVVTGHFEDGHVCY